MIITIGIEKVLKNFNIHLQKNSQQSRGEGTCLNITKTMYDKPREGRIYYREKTTFAMNGGGKRDYYMEKSPLDYFHTVCKDTLKMDQILKCNI